MEQTGEIKRRSLNTAQSTSGIVELAEPPVPTPVPLTVKYRPKTFSEVRGQPHIVSALQTSLQRKALPHSFLFVGPSGVGKTTLARILALHLGIDDIVEIDAASRSGVDDMRALAEQSQLSSLIGDRRIVIVDECHALSKQAWQPLLKIMEEPPSHLFWALCTTEGAKVPETIRTRCQEYKLQPVSNIELENMLDDMCETCDLPSAVKGQLVHYARGSARRLLSGAEMVYELDDPDQSRELLRQADESSESPAITCARLILSKRLSYERLRQLFPQMVEQNAESARIVMVRYIHQAALKAATIESADAALYALDVLRGPLSETTGESELLVALCALIPRKDAP